MEAIYRKRTIEKNKEKNKDKKREYRRDYDRNRRISDPIFKLRDNMRRRLRSAIHGNAKPSTTFNLIGCSAEELKIYIEKQFTPGMTWGNYGIGNGYWHIDHIVMISEFDLLQENELRLAFHYTNLRPLWQPDNLSRKFNIRRSEQTSIPQLLHPKLPQSD